VAALFVLLILVRFAWHFFRGDVQPDDPGGSMGRQMLGGDRAQRPEEWLKK
jgi:hypothetical protein